jgi:hypothetical protein
MTTGMSETNNRDPTVLIRARKAILGGNLLATTSKGILKSIANTVPALGLGGIRSIESS